VFREEAKNRHQGTGAIEDVICRSRHRNPENRFIGRGGWGTRHRLFAAPWRSPDVNGPSSVLTFYSIMPMQNPSCASLSFAQAKRSHDFFRQC
jgi:hypothetical protein